jgi:hypothetical protein
VPRLQDFYREDNATIVAHYNTTGTVTDQLLTFGFSTHFLSEKSDDELEALLSKRNCTKNLDANANSKLGNSSSCLATCLLRKSLLVSLGRVLRESKLGITLEASLAMGDLPAGSVVIAGSTMVQTCLGVLWKRIWNSNVDTDIFCSAKAAPKV